MPLEGSQKPIPPEYEKYPPGTLFIGGNDLVAKRLSETHLVLPYSSIKLRVGVDDYWMQIFSLIKSGRLNGGIHERSNLAQAEQEIVKWILSTHNSIDLILQNLGRHFMLIDDELKIGNPYWFNSPLKGQELEKFAEGIKFINPADQYLPQIINAGNSDQFGYDALSNPLPQGEFIMLPLTTAYIQSGTNANIVLHQLESGPQRKELHNKLGIIASQHYDLPAGQNFPAIQIAGTPQISMPANTALRLRYCVKYIDSKPHLMAHSASAIHRSTAIAAGTSKYKVGQIYSHEVITESHNDPQNADVFPSHVLAEAFHMEVVKAK